MALYPTSNELLRRGNLFDGPLSPFMSDNQIWDLRPWRSLLSDFIDPSLTSAASFRPKLDLIERPEEYKVRCDLPGFKKDDVSISVKDQTLTISGKQEVESEEKKENLHIVERRRGSFSRSVCLPEPVTKDKVQAKMNDGVLEICIGKANPEESSAKIEIQ
ncbi:hypothetical protein HDU78_005895 [Chytriomyces hyalinus]|nr:hypothetical protein HDU78_005895 [Chytriomyces hyalinus]